MAEPDDLMFLTGVMADILPTLMHQRGGGMLEGVTEVEFQVHREGCRTLTIRVQARVLDDLNEHPGLMPSEAENLARGLLQYKAAQVEE